MWVFRFESCRDVLLQPGNLQRYLLSGEISDVEKRKEREIYVHSVKFLLRQV